MKYIKTKFLMGTNITITIFGDSEPNIKDIDEVFELFHSLEGEFSRFLQDSRLNVLNTNRKLELSDRFIDVVLKCKNIYADTNFYFNPLINLPQLGYSKSFELCEFKKETIKTVNVAFDTVEIHGNTVSLQENQILDLGGIVKGFAVDLAKSILDVQGYKNYIVDAGGDIYVSGGDDDGKKIIVGIEDPFTPGYLLATLELKDKAIATSGNYRRKWTIEQQEYNHIINPLTGNNNNEITSITLIGDCSYLSDAYATACIAMGLEKTLAFLEQKIIDGIVVCSDKRIYTTDGIQKYNIKIL